MTQSRRLIPAVATAALALTCALAQATPVNFGVSAVTFEPGAGYGVDPGRNPENGGNRLDVLFGTTIATQGVTLDDTDPSFTFALGTVNFREPNTGDGNGNLGIRTDETDSLDLVVNMTLSLPTPMQLSLTAMVTAATGRIDDDAVDYALSWTPLEVDFGEGGSFRLALNTLSFADMGTQTLTATVTLLTAPGEPASGPPPATPVPEPATLALAAIALAGAGLARRRRRG